MLAIAGLLLLSYLTESLSTNSCLDLRCKDNHDLASCVLDQDAAWLCQPHEVCEVRVNQSAVSARCTKTKACGLGERCGSVANSRNSRPCVACCSDPACLLQLAAQAVVTSPLLTSPLMTSSQRRRQSPGGYPWHPPPPYNCYSDCHHGDFLQQCTASQFLCRDTEFCDVNIYGTSVQMHCKPVQDPVYNECVNLEANNQPGCPLRHPDQPCRYCCRYHDCLHQLFHPHVGTQTPSPMSTALVPGTTSSQQLFPGKESCFVRDCDHHADIHDCLQSQWACSSHQFCKMDVHKNGDVRMHCQNKDRELEHCRNDMSTHNSPECKHTDFLYYADCHFCCLDQYCIFNTIGFTPATTLSTPTNPTTTTTTTTAATNTAATKPTTTTTIPSTTTATTATSQGVQTTSPTPVITQAPCEDKYMGNCAVDFAGLCSDPNVRTVCPKTCGICSAGWSCKDHYHGNCSAVFAGMCSDPIVSHVCAFTCGQCGSSPTSPSPSTTSSTPAAGAACMDTFVGNCSLFNSLCHLADVQAVCRDTCHVCQPGQP